MFLTFEEHEAVENWAVVVLIIIIIIFTAQGPAKLFGALRLKKQELAGLQDMLNAVFKELTILGFISLLLFTTVQSGISQIINDRIFGQNETEKAAINEALKKGDKPAPPTVMQELFEDVHILIFVIMVMYIIETALLLLVGRYTIRAFEAQDRQTEEGIATHMKDATKNDAAEEAMTKETQVILAFFGLRERFLHPKNVAFPTSKEEDFEFSKYLSAHYTELLVEIIELPVPSLFIILLIVLVLRPFMDLEGTSFLIFLVAIAVGLFLLTVAAFHLVHRAYRMLLPDLHLVRNYLISTSIESDSKLDTVLKASRQDVFRAPIDQLPVFSKTVIGPRNRIERQFPIPSLTVFRTFLQLLLFFNAAYAAIVLRGAMSIIPKESELWWKHRYWSYPVTLGIICVNLGLWTTLIREFNYVCSLDCCVNEELIEEVEEDMEKASFIRRLQILRVLLHKADHAHATFSKERRDAEMDRVLLEFSRLPNYCKNLLTLIFTTVSRYHDRLGDEKMRGVVTKADMEEALRLMGWGNDKTSDYILTSWFDHGDENQDGFLTFTGFISVIMLSTSLGDSLKDPKETRASRTQRLKSLFDILDVNHDEHISISEFLQVLDGMSPRATEKEIRQLVKKISHGGTSITFHELVAFINDIEERTAISVKDG